MHACGHCTTLIPGWLATYHINRQHHRHMSGKHLGRRHSRPPHGCTFYLGLDSTHRPGSFVRSRHPCRQQSYRSVNKRSGREKMHLAVYHRYGSQLTNGSTRRWVVSATVHQDHPRARGILKSHRTTNSACQSPAYI